MKYRNSVITRSNITVMFTGEGTEGNATRTIDASHENYEEIKSKLKNENYAGLWELLNEGVTDLSRYGLKLINGVLVDRHSIEFPSNFTNKIVALVKSKIDATGYIRMYERLRNCPSRSGVEGLLRYSEANGLTVRPDGTLVLWKGVNAHDTTANAVQSIYDRNFWYPIGEEKRICRSVCADDPSTGIGPGLHSAGWRYVCNSYGGSLKVRLSFKPEDVTSVPNSNYEMMRTCAVTVEKIVSSKDDQGEYTPRNDQETVKVDDRPVEGGVKRIIKKKDGKEAVVKLANKTTIDRTTDRVTIPGWLMAQAGFKLDRWMTAEVLWTDKRARYLVVTTKSRAEDKPRVIQSVSLKRTSSGAISIRDNVLNIAQIKSFKSYVAEVTGPSEVTLRPKK